jgi:creatinine amidohydrolase
LIERENRILRAEGAVGFGWQTQDLNTQGVCGNAAHADASIGAVVVERAAQGLATLVGEVARFPLTRLVT